MPLGRIRFLRDVVATASSRSAVHWAATKSEAIEIAEMGESMGYIG